MRETHRICERCQRLFVVGNVPAKVCDTCYDLARLAASHEPATAVSLPKGEYAVMGFPNRIATCGGPKAKANAVRIAATWNANAELTTLRAQLAGLEERVRLLNAECWAWREYHDAVVNGDSTMAHHEAYEQTRAASDAASAVKEPA